MILTKRHILFGLLCLGIGVANWSALTTLLELSRRDMTASHLVLIPFVSIAFLYIDRTSIFASVKWDPWPVALPLAMGAVWLISAGASGSALGTPSLSLAVSVMVFLWIGGFVLVYGRKASRVAFFPLAFLIFTIPIPETLLNGIVLGLKKGSAETVAGLFTLSGTRYFREGFVFNLSTVAIEIVDECSGIRSSIALVLTSLIAGHLLLKTTWQKTALVAAAIPVAVLKNGIRIVTLTLLAVDFNPGFLNGRLHHEGGFVFFVVGLMFLLPVVGLLHRLESWRARFSRSQEDKLSKGSGLIRVRSHEELLRR